MFASASLKAKAKKWKMKKNAWDPVDFEEERRKDPKYKTELCKSFMETNFCVYGNKCRFAHGRQELISKQKSTNYKRRNCKSFKELGFCPYGNRCNFIHDERTIADISLPYYSIQLFINHDISSYGKRRLKCFEEITSEWKNNNDNCSLSTLSNDSNIQGNSNTFNSNNKESEVDFSYMDNMFSYLS